MPMIPPANFGQPLAGQTLEWMPSDTKETFEKLMQDPSHRRYFQEKGWDQPGAITYGINSHGFRCDEFDSGPYLLALGCSFTMGIGLPLQDIWPTLVGDALGLKVANLAWGGIGSDTCFRLAEYWIPTLKPQLVIMLQPPASRIEILLDPPTARHISQVDFQVFMPDSLSPFYNKDDVLLNHWFLNQENGRLNNLKNQLALERLCQHHGVPCHVYDSMSAFGRSREELEYARDHMHAGPRGHRLLAERMIDACR